MAHPPHLTGHRWHSKTPKGQLHGFGSGESSVPATALSHLSPCLSVGRKGQGFSSKVEILDVLLLLSEDG